MKEWYLLKSPHDQVSGYEDDALNDFGAEGFSEVLDSDFAKEVNICNYDFSEKRRIKAVIQNAVQDTKLKSLNRMMLVNIGTCKAGEYVEYNDQVWIINNVVDNNGVYEKALMSLCNWLLSWVNDEGKVVQRWSSIQSASQYNNGETGERFYVVRSDQLLVCMADDEEAIMIPDGKRFVIDRRCEVYNKYISEDVEKDLSKPLITYKVTRQDSVLFNYVTSGYMEFMVTQCEQHETDGYYKVDEKGYWLCEEPFYKEKDVVSPSAEIISDYGVDNNIVYYGLKPTGFTALFLDSNGDVVNPDCEWEIQCDFLEQLDVEVNGECISICPKTTKIINKSFELFLTAEGFAQKSITVFIRSLL